MLALRSIAEGAILLDPLRICWVEDPCENAAATGIPYSALRIIHVKV